MNEDEKALELLQKWAAFYKEHEDEIEDYILTDIDETYEETEEFLAEWT